MLDVTLSSQLFCFLCSLILGGTLSVVYSIFKAVRIINHHAKIAVLICDILFMLCAAFSGVIFAIGFTDGIVRYYSTAGTLIGFLCVKLTLGRLLDMIFTVSFEFTGKIIKTVNKKSVIIAKKVLKAWDYMLYNKGNKNLSATISRKGEQSDGIKAPENEKKA